MNFNLKKYLSTDELSVIEGWYFGAVFYEEIC